MKIRQANAADYDSLIALWNKCKLGLGTSDSREEIIRFIDINPRTSLVGEVNGVIAAGILGGFDGRRGLVHHLAVDPQYQKQGYGRLMLQELEKVFTEMGVVKLSFWVKTDNLNAVGFYKKLGYEVREDIITMSKVL